MGSGLPHLFPHAYFSSPATVTAHKQTQTEMKNNWQILSNGKLTTSF
jgi:hypothetical protein